MQKVQSPVLELMHTAPELVPGTVIVYFGATALPWEAVSSTVVFRVGT